MMSNRPRFSTLGMLVLLFVIISIVYMLPYPDPVGSPRKSDKTILIDELAAKSDLRDWFELRARCDKAEYQLGEPIRIDCEIINKTINSSYSIHIFGGNYGTVPFKIYDIKRKVYVKKNKLQLNAVANYRTYPPGFVYKDGFIVTDAFILDVAGDYEIQGFKELNFGLADRKQFREGRIQSDKIRITIK